MSADVLLDVSGLSVRFGGLKALDGVDLQVRQGQLVGLIGPNGAGKTTFIDALTGLVPSKGRVVLDGVDLTTARTHQRARAGLRRTWQAAELFDDLTVAENLEVAAGRPGLGQTLRELFGRRRQSASGVEEALQLLQLEPFADQLPTGLSLGKRKLVGVARALVGERRVVCLDEPAAGLDSGESAELGTRLRSLVDDSGVSMILIEHDMGLVMSICDYLVVLEFGQVIAAGTPAEVRADPRVIEAYLGAQAHERAQEIVATHDGVVTEDVLG